MGATGTSPRHPPTIGTTRIRELPPIRAGTQTFAQIKETQHPNPSQHPLVKSSASGSPKENLVMNPTVSSSMLASTVNTLTMESTHAPSSRHRALPTSSLSQGPEPPFNPIPVSKPCNINVDLFESLLEFHPDQNLVKYIVHGLRNGFDIGFTGPHSMSFPKNLKSADANKDAIRIAIEKEIRRGHTAGPFPTPPFPITHCSPIGAAPKKDGSVRLIMDLSQPHGSSINDDISKEEFSFQYSKFDDATDLLMKAGPGSLLCKLDIKHAYRLLPVRPDQWHLLCYCFEGKYYVDLVLPFGLRSSGCIFCKFADLVKWIITNHYHIEALVNYSDDFFAVLAKEIGLAKPQLMIIIQAFKDLNIPLAEDKIEGPCLSLIYLGIIINSSRMTIEVPHEKFVEAMTSLNKWHNRRTCTKRQLKSLIGKLGHISKVVRPGRMFSRRLIDLSTTVDRMHHHITLNKEARADIDWWIEFLPQWIASSMIPPSRAIRSTDLRLYSDASDEGFGATYGNAWIQGAWDTNQKNLSIDYRELYAIVAATFTWGHTWGGKRILFLTDNEPITKVWDKTSSPSVSIMSLIRPLYLFAACNGFSVSFKHIYGIYNDAADALSRFQMSRFRRSLPTAEESPTIVPNTIPQFIPKKDWTSSKTKH